LDDDVEFVSRDIAFGFFSLFISQVLRNNAFQLIQQTH
jgi:hypothetical protein